MSDMTDDLLDLLDLEPVEYNIYRGTNRDIGTGRIYGGQVLAQALVAAGRTVDEEDRPVHSIHGYFILPGELEIPVVYFVDRLRDGRSFTTRRVTAIQRGEAIFNMSSSFHRHEEGLEHQLPMPEVPGPEGLRTELDMIRDRAGEVPEDIRRIVTQDRPLDIRPVDAADPLEADPRSPSRCYWVRTVGALPDDLQTHQAVLAYASDYGLLTAALRPHGITFRDPGVMVASLDHAVWFHRAFRVDDWLLYVVESPVSAGARGFSRGTYFSRDGDVVASVAQEGVVRVRDR